MSNSQRIFNELKRMVQANEITATEYGLALRKREESAAWKIAETKAKAKARIEADAKLRAKLRKRRIRKMKTKIKKSKPEPIQGAIQKPSRPKPKAPAKPKLEKTLVPPKKTKARVLNRVLHIPNTPKSKTRASVMALDDDSIFPGEQALVFLYKSTDKEAEIYLYRIF